MLSLGTAEIALIFLVALFAVGPRRLPQVSRIIGRAVRYLKDNMNEITEAIKSEPCDDLKKEMKGIFDSKKNHADGDKG